MDAIPVQKPLFRSARQRLLRSSALFRRDWAAASTAHYRPDLWPDPERFDPERFIRARPNPYTFFPFGGGERRSLGAAFSTYVMKIVIARLLSRLDLRLAPGYRMRPSFHAITIAPSGGMPVLIDGRNRSTAAN
jgi:cytochrome P450 family 110